MNKINIKSKKFWLAMLANLVTLTMVITQLGGKIGIIASIVGTVAAAISYTIEYKFDVDKIKNTYDEVAKDIEKLKKGGD